MKKIFTPQVKIAVIAILAVVVLFFGMEFLKGLSIFGNDAHYKIKFNDITGLSTGAVGITRSTTILLFSTGR